MPYDVGSPPERIKGLPKEAQEIWIKVFNSAIEQYKGDEGKANATAWSAVEKAGWKKQGDKWVKYELETEDLLNREIFSIADDPNGHHYTEKELEEMVQGFHETKEILKPYLKLGHDEKQKLAQKSGMPALGWIENLRKEGKKLIADFIKVPKKLVELIKAGAYRRVSAEIFWNMDVGEKKYKKLLKAVSLLGADTPACGDLEDIISLYSADFQTYTSNAECHEYQFETGKDGILKEVGKNLKEEKKKMDELETLKKENETLKSQIEDFKGQVAKLTQEKEATVKQVEMVQNELKTKKEEEIKTQVNSIADKLIEEKHLLPAQKEGFCSLLFEMKNAPETKKYKIGEEEKTSEEILTGLLSNSQVVLNTGDKTEIGDVGQGEDNEATRKQAEAYQKEHNVSYPEALKAISK